MSQVKFHNECNLLYNSISDINECDHNNGGCAQLCNDTDGSFTCSCNPGYSLDVDGKSCIGKYILINHRQQELFQILHIKHLTLTEL